MMNSMTKDWTSEPTGRVPKESLGFTSNKKYKVPLATIEPTICANMYKGTYTPTQVQLM